jgi:hypothetical protein
MADVFGNNINTKTAGGLRFSGTSLLTFTGGNGADTGYESAMLVQNWNASYRYQLTKLRGLNSSNVFNVFAPPQGQVQIGAMVCEPEAFQTFLYEYGKPCDDKSMTLTAMGDGGECKTEEGGNLTAAKSIKLSGVKFDGITFQQQIQDLVLMGQVTGLFDQMDNVGAGGAALPPALVT